MWSRVIFSFILLLSILFLPFWLSVLLGLIGMFYFSFFIEAIVIFFLSDLLHGIQESRFLDITFLSLLISMLSMISMELIKDKLNLKSSKESYVK